MQFISRHVAKSMSMAQLISIRGDLINEKAKVTDRIGEAKVDAQASGIWMKPEAWKRLNSLASAFSAQINNIDTELALRDLDKSTSSDAIAVQFMNVARDYLDKYDFNNIMEAARQVAGK